MNKNPILLAVCCCGLALAAGCASPGAPQPPSLRLPVAVDNLSAARKGGRVILTWSPPTETTDHQPMRWATTTRICRVVNRFPINECGEPVKEINTSELVSVAPGAKRPTVSFEDVLPSELMGTQNQATYAVVVLNKRGRSAGLSNQVRAPLVQTAPPPEKLRATLDAKGPLLEWDVLSAPLNPSGIAYRLRIYRRATGKTDFALATELPYHSGPGEARDSNFDWEQEYDYKITSVTVLAVAGRPAMEVEGDDSVPVHLIVHDVFPPLVPSGLQAVFSSVGQKPFIDLTWAPNTESDLAGFVVYRRTAASAFAAVSGSIIKAPAWRDNDVHAGQKYYYAVAAIDLRGNQSAKSAPAEESVPLEVR
ncbi:MAG TPA: hypothetical protein VM578_02605 [Candidatus Saccharimonadales bacterium]|nr:hypothetical protein [Candidatus Saccharimonadales bacterium]